MLDKNPAPEGFGDHCRFCGRRIAEEQVVYHVSEWPGETQVAVGFCSEQCAKSYDSLVNAQWEEFEFIERAGAT